MKLFRDPTERYSILFLIITFFIGVILHLFVELRPLILKLTELYLFLLNTLLFSFGLLNNHRNLSGFTFWTVITILCIFLIQLLAFNTGLIYGTYTYGETFATKLSGIPVIIPFNWTMLILATYGSISKFFENRYIRALVSSIIVTILDFLMEPVANKLGYWHWELNQTPVQNYIAWFVISLIFSTTLAIMKIHARSAIFKLFLITQFIFYLIMILFL